ncbi:MAG: hypothetical protein E7007_02585 [Alphaproteobacteria bacterium]|nr:hypothetical protein [Alphaproteobacteria bacterium]
MKQICGLVIVLSLTSSAIGTPTGRAGRNVVNASGEYTNTHRGTAQKTLIGAPITQAQQNQNPNIDINTPSESIKPIASTPIAEAPDPELEQIMKYRNVCLSNNIGIGNTFVWAARDSNISNYTYMTEDLENQKNNTCFVRVDISSYDPRIDVSDIGSKYFEMGQNITCGSWVDEKMLEKRILDAKKSGRTWATVGGAVGSAAVGVGTMELFGNKLIGGKVMGQKALEGQELLRSQVLALKKNNQSEYNRIINALDDLENVCNDKSLWNTDSDRPQDCNPDTNPFVGLRNMLK